MEKNTKQDATIVQARNNKDNNIMTSSNLDVDSNDEVGQFAKYFKTFIDEINLANNDKTTALEKLEVMNNQLTNTLDELQATQGELIQKEKMAALGLLIAGIAHEINTPLGAIGASNENIASSIGGMLDGLPILNELSTDELIIFFQLVSRSNTKRSEITSREERKIKKKLIEELQDIGIDDSDDIADTLVDIGIYDNIENFKPLLDRDNHSILDLLYNIASIRKNSGTIDTATSKASKVVFALKKFSHHDSSGNKVPSDLNDDIETVLTLYYNQIKQGVEVIKNFTNIPEIKCYPDELNQVWTNLIHNSLQAMGNSGKLEIETIQENGNVVVSITDSGNGIPDEFKERIFEPFFTTKASGEGSGLGLDICKKIIEKHEGNIDFQSRPGRTTFKVKLSI